MVGKVPVLREVKFSKLSSVMVVTQAEEGLLIKVNPFPNQPMLSSSLDTHHQTLRDLGGKYA